MKYKTELLNYDSEWITYCDYSSKFEAFAAYGDLQMHGFREFQIRIVDEYGNVCR